MPKVCESCTFYSADNEPTACPQCGTGLKFTLLPPRGQVAAPLPNVGPTLEPMTASARARARKEGFLEGIGISEINPKYIWAAFLIVVAVGGFFARHYVIGQRLKAVQPGMHISDAARIIDGDDDDDEAYYNSEMVRFRDAFTPSDKSSGKFEYHDGPHHMIIHWYNGIVTRVDKKTGGGSGDGTITIIDGDDDD